MSFQGWPPIAESFGKPFDQIDRAMLASGAADSDRDIAPMVLIQHFQPMGQKSFDVILHKHDFRLVVQEVCDGLVNPREVAK